LPPSCTYLTGTSKWVSYILFEQAIMLPFTNTLQYPAHTHTPLVKFNDKAAEPNPVKKIHHGIIGRKQSHVYESVLSAVKSKALDT